MINKVRIDISPWMKEVFLKYLRMTSSFPLNYEMEKTMHLFVCTPALTLRNLFLVYSQNNKIVSYLKKNMYEIII